MKRKEKTVSLLHSFTPSLLHSFTPSLLHSFTPSLLHSLPIFVLCAASLLQSLGVSLAPIRLGGGGGVEVTAVEPGMPSHRAGVRAGMKLLTVEREPVDQKDVNDVAQMMVDAFNSNGRVTVTAVYAPAANFVAKVNVPVFEDPDEAADSEGTHVHFVGLEHIRPGSVRIIQTWACPRSLSTALMYSFAQRPDTTVVRAPWRLLTAAREFVCLSV